MADFYLLESNLQVPSRFWKDGYVNVKDVFLPFSGEGGIVTDMDIQTNKEWSVEKDLWCLAQVATAGEMLVLVVGDMWEDEQPDAYRWRVTPGRVEISPAERVVWKPWSDEEPPGEEEGWLVSVLALVRQEPLDVAVVQTFEPSSYHLPDDPDEAVRWLRRPYVEVTEAAYAHLAGQGADIFRTPEGLLVTFGQTGSRWEVMPIAYSVQRKLEG